MAAAASTAASQVSGRDRRTAGGAAVSEHVDTDEASEQIRAPPLSAPSDTKRPNVGSLFPQISLVSPIRVSLTLRRRLLLPNPRLPALWTQAEPLLARASRFRARGGRGRDGRANQELRTRRNRKEDQLAVSGGRRRRWGQCEYVTGELMRGDGSSTLTVNSVTSRVEGLKQNEREGVFVFRSARCRHFDGRSGEQHHGQSP